MMEESAFERGEFVLAHGARLVLFTDGVTEAQNPEGALWGEEPLLALLAASGNRPSAEIVAGVVDAVREFEGAGPPSDDITLMVARRI
jgi:sigma-B regulation protein RsbU (phosphoserine phosphatase)